MPFGSANAPATFQELMNQIIAIMKRRPKVQQLVRKGAVVEAYIDDVFLGSNTTEDHKALIDEFLSVCDECNTRVKIEKCEFMREVVEYLGFEVGYQWWKPVGQSRPVVEGHDKRSSCPRTERHPGLLRQLQFLPPTH